MRTAPAPAPDPAVILEVFEQQPHLHPYGIADVVQLWDRSTWWRSGSAVAGLLDLPGSAVPVLYAVSGSPAATLDLIEQLDALLPPDVMATGPPGLAAQLNGRYRAAFVTPYVKMHLARREDLPPPDPEVVSIIPAELGALQQLFDTDPSAGDFFHPGLLETGFYVGVWVQAYLAAAGGIHVIAEEHGVAALGNVTTHPAHRRRGLGRTVVATLCHRLLERVGTIGLNCREDNAAARGLYRTVGFDTILTYEETRLQRRNSAGVRL